MMQRAISLTVDYEIFGNGTGDVRQHVTEPTERMAALCEKFGVPLTIFVEVEEYLAFTRHRAALQRDLGYDPAALIHEQLVALARRGHDLQLHLHPQWHGSRYADGVWQLNPEIQTVDDLFESQEEVTAYIRDRKAVIDDIYAAAGSSARVCAYRAGAFSAQPGRKLLPALAGNGISVDSSVVFGLRHTNPTLNLDYRRAPRHRRHWQVAQDVAIEDPQGSVTEVPIHSVMGRRLFQMTFRRLRAKFSKNVPKERQKQMLGQLGIRKNPLHLLRFLFQPVPIKLDFHNLSASGLLSGIRSARPPRGDELDVLVLIGHTKEHVDDRHFEAFLKKVAADPQLQVVSMAAIAAQLAGRKADRTQTVRNPSAEVLQS